MAAHEAQRIRCFGVPYRQGWIEVWPGVHRGFVNLETWTVAGEFDLSAPDASLASLPDSAIDGNTEVELSLDQARALVAALQRAIGHLEDGRA